MKLPVILSSVLMVSCAGTTGEPTGPSDTADAPTPEAVCGVDAVYGLDVGECVLDFTLPDSTGLDFTLSHHRGKVALVDISAIW